MKRYIDAAAVTASPALSRRRFLTVTTLGGAGFVVGCGQREQAPAEAVEPTPAAAEVAPLPVSLETLNAFVRIGSDDTVTTVVKHLDKGQGVTTGLPSIVAEELDADWSQMRFEFAPADAEKYANLFFGVQGTGGSTAIANSWMQYRAAAAGARAMLVAAAAKRWSVPAAEITVAAGVVSHPSGQSARFGQLAADAASETPPDAPALKAPEDFKLLGTDLPRIDSAAKTDGSAQYTIDVDLPDMKVALVAHSPRFGGRVASFDATAAQAVEGVSEVIEVPTGVAVVADSFWSARKGRDALKIEWDDRDAELRGSDEIMADYRELAAAPGVTASDGGDVNATLDNASQVVELTLETPFLAHATMEPMDCVVRLDESGCEIWTGSQLQTVDQQVAAAVAGVPMGQVRVNTLFAGGSFGRRAVPNSDYIGEAVAVARASQGSDPVKLIWTREDDFTSGHFRPMSLHVMRAGIDAAGQPVGWSHRIVTQSILSGTPFEGMISNGIDPSTVEGAANLPYAVKQLQVDVHTPRIGVPALWWRSVGHTQNGWVTEVMIDQLAHAANADPVDYRLGLLEAYPRHRGVLERAASAADWSGPAPEGRFRGVAVHESFSSFVAQVAEIIIDSNKRLTVHRVVCAVDCGFAINPDIVRAQMEGGIGMGLGAFLREGVMFSEGQVLSNNYHLYRPLRISEMPEVEVHIVNSGEAPTGVGEPGLPPIAPAVTNAIFAATGQLITTLPLGDQLRAG
ncbi:MAG: xanthine dehydrogenase family protein molybdopterin-binding subunit [Pseudomonadota bacterium]